MLDSTDYYDQDMMSVSQQRSSQQHACTSGKHGTTKPKKKVLTLSILSPPSPPFPSDLILPPPPSFSQLMEKYT